MDAPSDIDVRCSMVAGMTVGARAGPGARAARAIPPAVAYLTGGGPKGRTLRPKVDSMMSPAA
jgi:hypothetical protein